MSLETRRYMRMIVLFDLPTVTTSAKRRYTVFRRFLLKDGYAMLQWSVYTRLVSGFDDKEKHLKRLRNNLPPEGSVRCLIVTEKQFVTMEFLVGPKKPEECHSHADQFQLF